MRTISAMPVVAFATVAVACSAPRSASDEPLVRVGCVSARLATAEGIPPSGALVAAAVTAEAPPGVMDVITSARVGAPSSEGDVCADVSANTGGAPRFSFVVGHAQSAYVFGPFEVARGGSCVAPTSCTQGGTLRLASEHRLEATVCDIAGVVHDVAGQPMADAHVNASDPSVSFEARTVLCTPDLPLCQPGAVSDADGRFAFTALVAHGPKLDSWSIETADPIFDQIRTAHTELAGCPAAPVTLTADQGSDSVRNLGVSLDGLEISWTGGFLATEIRVEHGDLPKWFVTATASGIASPVTYGRVPAGGVQRWPLNGGPPPFTSGDEISVFVSGTAPDGFPYTGLGRFRVP